MFPPVSTHRPSWVNMGIPDAYRPSASKRRENKRADVMLEASCQGRPGGFSRLCTCYKQKRMPSAWQTPIGWVREFGDNRRSVNTRFPRCRFPCDARSGTMLKRLYYTTYFENSDENSGKVNIRNPSFLAFAS